MKEEDHQVEAEAVKGFLRETLRPHITQEALEWLEARAQRIRDRFTERDFYLAFGMIPRRVGRGQWTLSQEDLQRAEGYRPGFCPKFWTVDQAARAYLILSIPIGTADEYVALTEKLFSTAEVGELVALYGTLPLMPFPERQHDRAMEGVRTNMTVVFDAIALNNPYPHDSLNENAWNQLVLKAVFMGRPLFQIYGIDSRANSHLAQMLSDFAHERWAAGRWVTPELWRPVGPFLTEAILNDLQRVAQDPDPIQQEAAALACWQSGLEKAEGLLAEVPELKSKIESGELTWAHLGKRLWERQ